MSATSAIAKWDPPNKNAEVVELYRILWKAQGSGRAQKVDTSRTRITIENLIPGIPYELVIKAGNANGTSQLTRPLKFITADEYIVETTQVYSQTPSIVGVLLAIILLIFMVGLSIWYFKGGRKLFLLPNSRSSTPSNAGQTPTTRSFENPYFNQEVTMSHLQVSVFLAARRLFLGKNVSFDFYICVKYHFS
jgi:hypothetical protein